MKKYLLILFILLSGCVTPQNPKKDFEDRMNRDLGRSIKFSGRPEKFGVIEKTVLPSGGKRLVFAEGRCKYAVLLNVEDVMIGWSYVGQQNNCWSHRKWWEPF